MNTPEYEERERHLERILEDITTEQLMCFALWELLTAEPNSSDALCSELLRRSGAIKSVAKY